MGLVTSTFSGCLLAMKGLQKKVPSMQTCHRLPLVNNRAVGHKSLPVGSMGRRYLKCLAQAIYSSDSCFCMFPVTLLSVKHFSEPTTSLFSSRKLVQGRSWAPQKYIKKDAWKSINLSFHEVKRKWEERLFYQVGAYRQSQSAKSQQKDLPGHCTNVLASLSLLIWKMGIVTGALWRWMQHSVWWFSMANMWT